MALNLPSGPARLQVKLGCAPKLFTVFHLVPIPEQAVAKGDAAAVAKKAADDARAAQEAQVDALFASDEEDEDYNPEAS